MPVVESEMMNVWMDGRMNKQTSLDDIMNRLMNACNEWMNRWMDG